MDLNSLKEAMRRRKGAGLDISLLVNGEEIPLTGEMAGQSMDMDMDADDDGSGGAVSADEQEPENEKLMDLAPEVKDSAGEMPGMSEMLGGAEELPMAKKAMAMRKKPL